MTRGRRALLALAVVAISGCSVLLTFDGFGECRDGACAALDEGGSGTDAESDSKRNTLDAAAACSPFKWPGPPDADPGGSTSLAYAVREVRFGNSADASVPSFDVNNRCVCPGGVQGKGTCVKDAALTCDDPATGVDNVFGELFSSFALFDNVFISDVEANKSIARGEFSYVIRVDEYSGAPDDGRVSVSFYNALRVDRDGGGAPTFEPGERWVADRNFLFDPPSNSPKFFDAKAYVTNGTLVAFFAELELVVSLPPRVGRFRFKATDVHLVMPLAGVGAPTRASLVGRIALSALVDLGGVLGWCPGTTQFKVAIVSGCNRADVNAKADDNGAAPCDAMSSNFELLLVPTQKPETTDVGSYSVSTCPSAKCP